LIRFSVQTIPLNGELDVEKEREFLNSAVEYFRLSGADLIIPATFNSVFRTYPDGATAAPYGSYILNLGQSEEALWKNLHQKHRNVIRNAMKKDVKIRDGAEELETAFELVRDSFMRSARGFLGKIRIQLKMDCDGLKRQILALGENVKVFIAEYEGVVQGCAVIPFSNYSAYYMHGGSIPKPLTGAMNLLQWEAIRLFHGLGVQYYDFFGARMNPEKGSKAEGIIRFKERFGAQFIQGYMWKFPFSPLKYALYSLASRLRSNGDVVDQERHKLTSN
jgi:lipid II:glycine glycyltransferase (peptidoglycan interpeptide bridge formation enzyme)